MGAVQILSAMVKADLDTDLSMPTISYFHVGVEQSSDEQQGCIVELPDAL